MKDLKFTARGSRTTRQQSSGRAKVMDAVKRIGSVLLGLAMVAGSVTGVVLMYLVLAFIALLPYLAIGVAMIWIVKHFLLS